MHGVKRLFSWMLPRFDREHFNVPLVSLRRKDLSEETLRKAFSNSFFTKDGGKKITFGEDRPQGSIRLQ